MSRDATRWVAPLLVLLAAVGAGCGEDRRALPPAQLPINERSATYRGVGLASSRAEIESEFGTPEPYSDERGVTAVGGDFYELGLPRRVAPPSRGESVDDLERGVLRYRDAAFQTTEDEGAYAFTVVSPAKTLSGIAIGQRLRAVRKRYPKFRCGVSRERGGRYPYCTGRAESGVYLWFGQDPIRSITLASKPMRAARRRARQDTHP